MGALAGLAHATVRVPRGRIAQGLAGLTAATLLVTAWALALSWP
jgi:hypothetical protein